MSSRSSSTSRNQVRRAWPLAGLLAGLAVASCADAAHAMDRGRALSQYLRDQWGTERGFPGGPVYAFAQTPDGHLWIGTERGLVRFDGLTFHLVQHASVNAAVLGLTTDADGALWVRLEGPTLLRYQNGRFEDVTATLDRPEVAVTAMSRNARGVVLLATLVHGALAYGGGRFSTLASVPMLPGSPVISLAQTPDGTVWMGTRDTGLYFVRHGRVAAAPEGLPDRKINCLLAVGDRDVWIGTDNGVVRWDGTRTVPAGPPALDRIQVLAMIGDRESNIWIATASHGLLRVTTLGGVRVAEADRQSRAAVTALFEDREGNLWTGSAQGIHRLRDAAFMTYSASEGLPSEINGPIHADGQGRIWFAPLAGGLYWLDGRQVGRVTRGGLERDVVYSIAGRRGDVWVGTQRGGLTRLRDEGGSVETRTYTQAHGLAQNSVYAVHEGRDGTVWAGTLSGGVSRWREGRFTTYTVADGLGSNTVTSIAEGSNGTMWFGTPNGLSSLSDGRWGVRTVLDGLPSDSVSTVFEDSTGGLWLGTANGLALLTADRIQVPARMPASLHEQILGIAEDARGSLWIATVTHVVRVARDRLARGRLTDADVREYGLADGLRSVEGVKRDRSVVADPFGRIWFSMNRGLSVVDVGRATGSAVPAMVHVDEVSADGQSIDRHEPVRIAAGHERIVFRYAGLSLAVPERVRFRYLLEGFDRAWSDPLAAREAVYTNLAPGSYRFRVRASNSDGVWSSTEATVAFDVQPFVWQTWWFRLLSVLAFGLAAWALYRVRVRQLARQLTGRFEERLAERTRIAQELHDTLLQGFLSASMQLHVAADHLPDDSPVKPRLGRVLELMSSVIEEGRNAVRGLRSADEADDLEQAFYRIRDELTVPEQTSLRVIVEGRRRPVGPVIRDEVYRIGREALVNAIRHSGARSIEVEIAYGVRELRLLVRDDGCGIDPQVLHAGREGHWGLPGMRERAERIGARLKVWSRPAAGTEIELSVPRHIAFGSERPGLMTRWLSRASRQATDDTDLHRPR